MVTENIRVGFITALDANNPRSWSGTPYFMSQALSDQVSNIDYIGSLAPPFLTLGKATNQFRRMIGLPGHLPKQTHRIARYNARQITRHLSTMKPDILFSLAGSQLISKLDTDLPLAYCSGSTVRLMAGYNPEFQNVSAGALRQADELEAAAIARADLLIYPTEWAAESARRDYGADPARIHIAPFGANLRQVPSRSAALADRSGEKLRLLFVGVNWVHKGGQIAVDARRELERRGIPVELVIVGCVPPPEVPREGLSIIPFLDKNDPAQLQKLSELYTSADLFILPTQSECFGIVFCEAAAHGVPSIAPATGGVPDVIRDGITGFTLPEGSEGVDYADLIYNLVSEPAKLAALRKTARDDYENRLNWEVWAKHVAMLLAGAIRG